MTRAIERRRVDDAAQALLDRTLWDAAAAPVGDAAAALTQLAGRLGRAVEVLAEDVDRSRDGAGLADPVATLAWSRAMDSQRKLLADMVRLGVAQRDIELEADKIRLVEAGIYAVLDFLGAVGEQRDRALAVLFTAMQTAATAPATERDRADG